MGIPNFGDPLAEARDQASSVWSFAKGFWDRDGGRRNELGLEAAEDHRARADALCNHQDSVRWVCNQLKDCRDHAERWEHQFRV
jgi:hypothetical protein